MSIAMRARVKNPLSATKKAIEGVNKWMGILATFLIVFMMVNIVAEFLYRFATRGSIRGVIEFDETLLVVSVFLALAAAQMYRGHVRLDLMLDRLPSNAVLILEIIGWLVCIAFFGTMGFATWNRALYSFSIKEVRWGVAPFPIWWAMFSMPLGCAMICLQFVVDIGENIRRIIKKEPPVRAQGGDVV